MADTWEFDTGKKKIHFFEDKNKSGGGGEGEKKKKKFISFQSVLKIRLRWFIHTSLSLYRINEVYLD